MAYAYRDKYGILHCSISPDIADIHVANGKVVFYDGVCSGGYPTLADGREILDYGNGEIWVDGNRGDGKRVEECTDDVKADVAAVLDKIGL